jgi:hypothetical protein
MDARDVGLRFTYQAGESQRKAARRFLHWADKNELSRDDLQGILGISAAPFDGDLLPFVAAFLRAHSEDMGLGEIREYQRDLNSGRTLFLMAMGKAWFNGTVYETIDEAVMADRITRTTPCQLTRRTTAPAIRSRRSRTVRRARAGSRGDPSEPGPRSRRPLVGGRR